MKKIHMSREQLVAEAIEQMKLQIAENDWTVIEGLLQVVDSELLRDFLPNEEQD
jgi:hypothetical protein